ncbi:EsaB/YukD family protein [Rossellomorea aquimaris]|uniref:EsaB/YukD family protein n=1 Tax=Rossellomorea aquimaris TaxID=189382 RepID=UPI001CD6EA80|nr:EsaB/YukD family protein [Rossellomorea aquimaris]MCA1054925.1 EsaB/YukD family protein [Rossellomorea aquimaris]
MADDKAIVILKIHKKKFTTDLEIPLNISANELVIALNAAYDLNIDVSNVKDCYLKSENPIALLKGNKLLSEFGVINGTVINFTQ